MSDASRKPLAVLQAYRALAALLVLAYHARSLCLAYGLGDAGVTTRFGFAGVVFFFALSGFIMGWVHEKDFGIPARVGDFFRKRLLRIYPVYWVVVLFFLPFWIFAPRFGLEYHREWLPLLKSLLLVPQAHPPHLYVAWTLSHEMLFYLAFAALLLSRKAGAALLALWAMAILARSILGVRSGPLAEFLLSPLNLLFPAGLLAAFAVRRWGALRGKAGLALFALGNLVFCLGLSPWGESSSAGGDTLIFGVASVLVLLGATAARADTFFARRAGLLYLGGASYSLYLVHDPAMLLVAKALSAAGIVERLPLVVAFPLFALAGLAAGLALHRWVEAPLLRAVARRGRGAAGPRRQ